MNLIWVCTGGGQPCNRLEGFGGMGSEVPEKSGVGSQAEQESLGFIFSGCEACSFNDMEYHEGNCGRCIVDEAMVAEGITGRVVVDNYYRKPFNFIGQIIDSF